MELNFARHVLCLPGTAGRGSRRLTSLAVVLIGTLLSVRMPANALQLRCASEELPPTELTDVAKRAQRVAPRDGGTVALHNACWNRDFAIASFETPPAVESDGVQWWWDIRCDREVRRRWSCAAPERTRRIEVTVADESGPATIVGWLPEDTGQSRQDHHHDSDDVRHETRGTSEALSQLLIGRSRQPPSYRPTRSHQRMRPRGERLPDQRRRRRRLLVPRGPFDADDRPACRQTLLLLD